jgi:hypothetical protein
MQGSAVGELEPAKSDDAESILIRGIVPELLFGLAVLSPEREKAVGTYLERVESRRRHRAVEFEEEVLKQARLSPDEFLQRILEDEAAAELFEQAVMRAIASAEEKKRKALAKAVASGLLADDAASMDVAQVQMRAIGALEPSHFRLLLGIKDATVLQVDAPSPESIGRHLLAAKLPWAGHALHPMLFELQSQGLVYSTSSSEGESWGVTPFGRSVLDFLKETTEPHRRSTPPTRRRPRTALRAPGCSGMPARSGRAQSS